jgi:hypothetical protein
MQRSVTWWAGGLAVLLTGLLLSRPRTFWVFAQLTVPAAFLVRLLAWGGGEIADAREELKRDSSELALGPAASPHRCRK